jgi:hypothetical protein
MDGRRFGPDGGLAVWYRAGTRVAHDAVLVEQGTPRLDVQVVHVVHRNRGRLQLVTSAASSASSAVESTVTVTPVRVASQRNSVFFGPVATMRSGPRPAPRACCNSPSEATSTSAAVAASSRSGALDRLALFA